MKKPEILIIALSLLATCAVSAVFGLAGAAIIGTFWAWFVVSFMVQVVGFLAWNSFLAQKEQFVAQQLEIEALDQLSRFTVSLACAYCQQKNTVPIQLNQKNTFKCGSCNQVNGVFMQFTATTLTTPIESVKLPALPGSESIEFKVSR